MSTLPSLLFLSYASRNLAEVIQFDLALRRFGVPLWRDRTDLGKGALTVEDIKLAAQYAVGFTFYLTREAAESEFVRERERQFALENARNDGSIGIVPIFRHARKEVTQLMLDLAKDATNRDGYDLSPFNGYIFDEQNVKDGLLPDEMRNASETVLLSLLRTKAKQAGHGASLRIGLMTRDAPVLRSKPLDLLVDWTADFPPSALRFPHGDVAKRELVSALHKMGKGIAKVWTPVCGTRFQIIPQCHLSMAIAAGYQFRRNTGAVLDVVDAQSGAHLNGPNVALPGEASFWSQKAFSRRTGGGGLAVSVSLSRDIKNDVERTIRERNLDVSELLAFEPSNGASQNALETSDPDRPHKLAVSIVSALHDFQAKNGTRPLHLFIAAPAVFAVLLGQQLSNVGAVQLYEWEQTSALYVPTLFLD